MRLDRRSLLVAGGAGIGLVVAFTLWPRQASTPLAARPGERLFGPYLKIAEDGTVTVAVPQAETGQGIWTGLAQVAADALGAAWERVAIEPAPAAPDYANPMFGTRLTADSSSVRAFEDPFRRAGETARSLLVRAAAARWGIDAGDCRVGGGFVRSGNRVLGFGELAADAAGLGVSNTAAGTLDARLLGQPLPRLDLAAKSDGSMRFAADVRLPDMLFAAARLAPPGGSLVGHDRAAAMARPGVRAIVAETGWIAAIGETGWAAEQALAAARPQFQGRAADTASVDAALDSALTDGKRSRLVDRGDYEQAVGDGRALEAVYRIAPALHRSLEPLSATARFDGARLDLWAPVQAFDGAVRAAASVAGIEPSAVTLYPTPVGDGGGRAVEADAVPIAVALARRTGRPIQLTLSHRTSANHDIVRPPLLARMTGLPSPTAGIGALRARYVTAPGLGQALSRMGIESADALAAEEVVPPYAIPNLAIETIAADLAIRTGYMRGGTPGLVNFALESFVDEMARRFAADPLSYRIAMLSAEPRLARALTTAATSAGWDGGGPGSRMGLAAASAFGSRIALVASAGLGSDQSVEVERLVAAVDCGRIVNPALVRQQVEGGLLHALSLATAPAPAFVAGMPVWKAGGLRPALQVPAIEVILLPSREESGGVSGLGHTVLAPAIANALASATGRRLRTLPFDPMAA